MPKYAYKDKRFTSRVLRIIGAATSIIKEFQDQGFDLTLRQLYYQFVTKEWIDNVPSEYKRLGSIINDARMAGLIDWNIIVDRTRHVNENPHWEKPSDIIKTCVTQFQIDKWGMQPTRVEVWIEKDALLGVIERICQQLDVPYFSCRGYTSQSEMWRASTRIIRYQVPTVILHLGDHDPSGIDMTRDIRSRLFIFTEPFLGAEGTPTVERIALNMDQIKKYKPPPNPAKETDSRAYKYIKLHGEKSWELDALTPQVLEDLISTNVLRHRDERLWKKAVNLQKKYKTTLRKVAKSLTPA